MRTMRVVEVLAPGGPEVLATRERPVPAPGEGEVLIRVAAAGLNRADLLQRRGAYPPPPGAPPYPGLEVSGTVEAQGPGAKEFRVGARVCALLAGGGYAEYCVAPEAQVLEIPAGLDFTAAAALPEACFTVWSNVFRFGRLAPGETLLVHGGTSGIGVVAVQLARLLGHDVLATAGTPDKCRYAESLGARCAIDYRLEDFVARTKELTSGRGVDVILDVVGGDYLPRNLQALANDGRLVIIATQSGTAAEVDLRLVMRKRLTITGSTLRPQPVAFKGALRQELLRHVWPLVANGQLRPVIDRIFPFTDAAAAHARMEHGDHIGKLILDIDA